MCVRERHSFKQPVWSNSGAAKVDVDAYTSGSSAVEMSASASSTVDMAAALDDTSEVPTTGAAWTTEVLHFAPWSPCTCSLVSRMWRCFFALSKRRLWTCTLTFFGDVGLCKAWIWLHMYTYMWTNTCVFLIFIHHTHACKRFIEPLHRTRLKTKIGACIYQNCRDLQFPSSWHCIASTFTQNTNIGTYMHDVSCHDTMW